METESTESMSFPLAILVCLQSLMWWWYGVIKDDGYIQVRLFHNSKRIVFTKCPFKSNESICF